MKITIIQLGETPAAMVDKFGRHPPQIQDMFNATGHDFRFEVADVLDGEPFPDLNNLDGIIIPGSAKGAYDIADWMNPLRAFIREAYAARKPMLGICFGHQIMADALGGEVRKSEKGWGLGRQVYDVLGHPGFMGDTKQVAIAASHQDQVITPPSEAEVFLSSGFTPNAGLIYKNGAAISLQPHPEFDLNYSRALVELRRGNPLNGEQVAEVDKTLNAGVDNAAVAKNLARFFIER